MGGETLNPTYESICTGLNFHAEVVQIHFKPKVITYEAILKRFWLAHDPTTLNRQGGCGNAISSAIFTHSVEQAEVAEVSMAEANKLIAAPIVTQVALATFTLQNYSKTFIKQQTSNLLPNGDSSEIRKFGWRWCVMIDLCIDGFNKNGKNHSFAVFSSKDTGTVSDTVSFEYNAR